MVPIDGEVREGVGLLGSPQLRDPAVGRARQPVRPPADRRTSCAAASPPRTGTTSRTMALFLLARWLHFFVRHRCSAWPPSTSTACSGASAIAAGHRRSSLVFTVVYFVLVERAVAGVPAAAAAVLLDLRPRLLAARALLEAVTADLPHALQRHPVQERDLAAAGRPDRPQGLRRRLLHRRSGPSSPSATTARSTRAARSSATRRRTAPSSPTASRSAPAAPSGSAPSSTTA